MDVGVGQVGIDGQNTSRAQDPTPTAATLTAATPTAATPTAATPTAATPTAPTSSATHTGNIGVCPDDCVARNLACRLCDDGETCASPVFECADDGSCREVAWQCKGGNSPSQSDAGGSESTEPNVCECAVRDVCHACPDGSCATWTATCNPDGSCGEVVYACKPKYDCDIRQVMCEVAINCQDGQVPTRDGNCYGPCVDPNQCKPGTIYDCDISQVGCKLLTPDCGPDLVPTQDGYCYGECVDPSLCAPLR